MEPEPESCSVEVPAGRVLRCGAVRPGGGSGTAGGRGEGVGDPGLGWAILIARC